MTNFIFKFLAPYGFFHFPLAELLQNLETRIFNSINIDANFYYRYVADIITCISTQNYDLLLYTFNSFNNNLKLSFEKQLDNSTSFLDDKIIKIADNLILTNCYQKPT